MTVFLDVTLVLVKFRAQIFHTLKIKCRWIEQNRVEDQAPNTSESIPDAEDLSTSL